MIETAMERYLEKLRVQLKPELRAELKPELREQVQEKVRQEHLHEIARTMLAKGIDIPLIIEITDMAASEIEALKDK
jgi:hypothetical protein